MKQGLFLRALRVACCVGLPWLASGAGAAPVGDALERPALAVRQPARAVFLGAAMAGPRLVAVGERGMVVLSDDGGAQWRQAPVPTSVTLTAVRFADDRRGVAVGHGATVLVTDDGGATWTRRLDGRQAAALALEAARRSGDPGRIKEAQQLQAQGADKPFLDVLLWDAQKFLAVGAYGIAFATTDGGLSWSPWMDRIPNAKGHHLYVASRFGDTLLIAGEQGLLARSGDNGKTFSPLPSPYKGSWFAAALRQDEIVLAGLRGNVWRSANAGKTWVQIGNPSQASITSLVQSQGQLLLANHAGMVLRLQGDALSPLNREPMAPLAGLVTVGDRLFGVGVAGIAPVAGSVK